MSFKTARLKMRAFQQKMNKQLMLGTFILLSQTRYDMSNDLAIFGCTLFSRVSRGQEFDVESRMVHFRDILR